MKTIGLIGGISWHSTAVYYECINRSVHEAMGGNYSARLILYSVNFHEFKLLQTRADWQGVISMLGSIAVRLEQAGADCVMIGSNTPHVVAEAISSMINIPFLHIADETVKEIRKQGIKKVGLLGTKFTMEHAFFTDRLSAAGIEALIPEPEDRNIIHGSIIDELSVGVFRKETREEYYKIIDKLREKGAEAIIMGCTEIGLLLDQSHCDITLFDTTVIHSAAASRFALSDQNLSITI